MIEKIWSLDSIQINWKVFSSCCALKKKQEEEEQCMKFIKLLSLRNYHFVISNGPWKTQKYTQVKTIVLKFMYSSMIPNDDNNTKS